MKTTLKKTLLKTTLLSFILVSSFISCKKEKDDIDSSLESAEANSTAETYFNEIYRLVDTEGATNSAVNGRLNTSQTSYTIASAGCADSVKVITTGGGFPKTLTMYYHNSDCDGRIVNGQIVSVFTGKYRDSLTKITTTLSDFSINGNMITGTKEVTNNGRNANGNLNYSIVVSNGSIQTTAGTISWSSARNREWTEGSETLLNLLDDEHQITGSANGTNRQGVNFVATITNPIVIKLDCRYITQGTVDFSSGKTVLIDYGTGVCDNDATVSIDGNTYPIKLK
jgi:hypothetical protein